MNRRPLTIWIVQIILAVFVLSSLVGGAISIWQTLTAAKEPSLSPAAVLPMLFFEVAWQTVLLTLASVGFVGLRRRKAYGRWLSLATLVLWLSFIVYLQPNPFHLGQDNGNAPSWLQYSNRDQMVGAVYGRVSLQVFLLILIFRMAFAKSVKVFFQKNEVGAGVGL